MKNLFGGLVLAGAFLASCNDSSKTSENGDRADTTCYQAVNENDSIQLKLIVKGTAVTGSLTYHIMEKDKNTGTLLGEMKNDTIFASYHFLSEGTQSVREVAFLKKGNNLVQGFGPVEDKAGIVIFENRSVLVFDEVNSLVKVNCVP